MDCTSGSSSDSDSMTVIGGGPGTTGTAATAGEETTKISGTALAETGAGAVGETKPDAGRNPGAQTKPDAGTDPDERTNPTTGTDLGPEENFKRKD